MNVNLSEKISEKHFIEWGEATWDEDDFSIRNRKNRDDGGFNQSASSEIPWYDFIQMIHLSIEKKQFSKNELKEIIVVRDKINIRVVLKPPFLSIL